MKFSIVGADIETGKERRIVIQAEDEDKALANAKLEGIQPYQVTEKFEPQVAETKNDNVVAIVAGGILVLFVVAIVGFVAIKSTVDHIYRFERFEAQVEQAQKAIAAENEIERQRAMQRIDEEFEESERALKEIQRQSDIMVENMERRLQEIRQGK